MLEKILTGDVGDGIPNIKSPDDQSMREDAPRQGSITQKIKEHAKAAFDKGELPYFGDKTMDMNFRRNQQLIDFDFIPEHIYNSIVAEYQSAVAVKDKGKIFNYFIKNRCKLLMEHINSF